jgi:hypothetical protein
MNGKRLTSYPNGGDGACGDGHGDGCGDGHDGENCVNHHCPCHDGRAMNKQHKGQGLESGGMNGKRLTSYPNGGDGACGDGHGDANDGRARGMSDVQQKDSFRLSCQASS